MSTSSTTEVQVTEAEVTPAPRVATKAARRYDPPTKPRLERMKILHRQYLSSGHPDDVIFGEWRFDCPFISKLWSSNWEEREDIVWKIHPPQNGENCVWVVFKQVVVEGILRINWNTGQDWRGKPLEFTFRGQETGEGYAQVSDSCNHGTITFTSLHEQRWLTEQTEPNRTGPDHVRFVRVRRHIEQNRTRTLFGSCSAGFRTLISLFGSCSASSNYAKQSRGPHEGWVLLTGKWIQRISGSTWTSVERSKGETEVRAQKRQEKKDKSHGITCITV